MKHVKKGNTATSNKRQHKPKGFQLPYGPDEVFITPSKLPMLAIPTNEFGHENGNHHHLPKIREGRLSWEVFCKNPERRIELGLPVIVVEDQ